MTKYNNNFVLLSVLCLVIILGIYRFGIDQNDHDIAQVISKTSSNIRKLLDRDDRSLFYRNISLDIENKLTKYKIKDLSSFYKSKGNRYVTCESSARTGNYMFYIASSIGIGLRNGMTPVFKSQMKQFEPLWNGSYPEGWRGVHVPGVGIYKNFTES